MEDNQLDEPNFDNDSEEREEVETREGEGKREDVEEIYTIEPTGLGLNYKRHVYNPINIFLSFDEKFASVETSTSFDSDWEIKHGQHKILKFQFNHASRTAKQLLNL